MIVDEEHVAVALDYLAMDPHPLALARKELVDAENAAKRAFALALLAAQGTESVRKARAETNDDYMTAKDEEAEAVKELERHRARVRSAEMLISIFQTESANARNAERVR